MGNSTNDRGKKPRRLPSTYRFRPALQRRHRLIQHRRERATGSPRTPRRSNGQQESAPRMHPTPVLTVYITGKPSIAHILWPSSPSHARSTPSLGEGNSRYTAADTGRSPRRDEASARARTHAQSCSAAFTNPLTMGPLVLVPLSPACASSHPNSFRMRSQ